MSILSGHAVRIAEATRLYFLRRGRHGWRSRTAGGEHICLHRRPGDQRLHVRQKLFLGSQRYFGRLILGNDRLFLDQFGGNAHRFRPRRYRFGDLRAGTGNVLTGAGACGTGGGVLTRLMKW